GAAVRRGRPAALPPRPDDNARPGGARLGRGPPAQGRLGRVAGGVRGPPVRGDGCRRRRAGRPLRRLRVPRGAAASPGGGVPPAGAPRRLPPPARRGRTGLSAAPFPIASRCPRG